MRSHHTRAVTADPGRWRSVSAAAAGAAVGVLGGLLGLGGAEFRLPLLVRGFGYDLRPAIPLNLAISLMTVVAAATTRILLGRADLAPLAHFGVIATAMMLGGMTGAARAVAWLSGTSDATLHRLVRALLLGIGGLLIVEAALPWSASGLPLAGLPRTALAGIAGLLIGAVSSLLGVAGGELIIPVLMFGFGAPVKVAGTLSLLISLPTIITGLWRHHRQGAALRVADVSTMIIPVGLGSMGGAVVGGLLVSYVPGPAVKLLLGLVLIGSALNVFSARREK